MTGLSGDSGGVSIETFLMNVRPGRENQAASFDIRSDENTSDMLAPAQPPSSGARTVRASNVALRVEGLCTLNFNPVVEALVHHLFAASP